MGGSGDSPVAVLGLGPMGRALAGAFVDGGYPTTVWNRTPGKADALAARGAIRADTVADAVSASALVLVCVIDYDAVHAVVEPVSDTLRGRTLVNLTADTPERARRAAAWAAGHGIDYLDGTILTPAPTIGGPAAVFLYSGPEAIYQSRRSALDGLGGTATYVGADPGRAAAFDVALLDIFWTAMSGIAHAFALASAEDIAAEELAPFARGIGDLLPDVIDSHASNLQKGHHPGDVSNIVSAAAGMDHIIHASRVHNIDTGVLSAAKAIAQRAIDAGRGNDDYSRLSAVLGDSTPAASTIPTTAPSKST